MASRQQLCCPGEVAHLGVCDCPCVCIVDVGFVGAGRGVPAFPQAEPLLWAAPCENMSGLSPGTCSSVHCGVEGVRCSGASRQGSWTGNAWRRQGRAMAVCLCVCVSLCFDEVLLHGVVCTREQQNSDGCT